LTQRSRTDTQNNTSSSKTESFAYDAELRLTQVETEGILFNDRESFTLDGVGNRTQHSETSNPWQYDANNRLTKIGQGHCGSANTLCYSWDAEGNQTRKEEQGKTTHYRYDTQNRLIEVSSTTNNAAEQLIARYGYDPFNRRIWKEQFANRDGQALEQAKRTYYLYSDEGLIAEEEQAITLNADGSTTATRQPQISTQYAPRPDSPFGTGVLFVKTRNSNGQETIAHYHHDHLDTPVLATDSQGNIVWSASYGAFGRASITTPEATQDKPTIISNLRLPGQYEDEETGLHYNWNRYYDPETGRYVTQDPIGLEGGINFYLYVNGNPLIWSDYLGLKYTQEECKLLKQFIEEQKKTLKAYEETVKTGIPAKMNALTHTASGCNKLYPDEGRRLACVAHENEHKWWHYFLMTPSFYDDKKDWHRQRAKYEVRATTVGIREAEDLFKKNCEEEGCE
jgi:RHS repeat-associated protein